MLSRLTTYNNSAMRGSTVVQNNKLEGKPTGVRKCPCVGKPVPPIYGGQYNPNIKPQSHRIKIQSGTSNLQGHKKESRGQIALKALEQLHLPYAPKPYTGPYNVMWNPHVCRGSSLIHFTTVERKRCADFKSLQERARFNNRKGRHDDSPEYGYGGKGTTKRVTHPDPILPLKKELTDFSMFLVEQEEDDFGKYKNVYSQTDKGSQLLPPDSQEEETEQKDCTQVKNNWVSGMDVGSQGDWCHISAETKPTVNPRQEILNELSEIISEKILSQSLLETVECAELELIRGECEAINLWMAQEQRRKFQEKRNFCKNLLRKKLQEEMEMEAEEQMKEVEDRVGVILYSKNFMRTLIERGFSVFLKDGILEGTPEAKASNKVHGTQQWIDNNVEITLKNKMVAKNVLDNIIIEASKQRYEDHKSATIPIQRGFLQRVDVSSSLKVEIDPKNSTEVKEDDEKLLDSSPEQEEEPLNDKYYENYDGEDEMNQGREVIRLMEPNPHFNNVANE